MAACEKCGRSNWGPEEMKQQFDKVVGPCCVGAPVYALPSPAPNEQPQYGLEVSNKVGVRAYVEWAGMKLEFKKSPDEIKRFFDQS